MNILENFTILYVEDSNTMVNKISDALKDKVKKLYIAKDGIEGLEVYKKFRPDIVISDVIMPKLNGLEMGKKIKEISPNQAIMILTAHDSIDILKETINLGACKIIFKPVVDFDVLINPLMEVAKNLQNSIDAENLRHLKLKEEREEFLLSVIKQISHHWKQPLSIISTLSSACSYQKEMGIEVSIQEDIDSAKLITRKTQELANILEAIDNIDYKNVAIEEIEKLIQISNPMITKTSNTKNHPMGQIQN